MKFEVGTTYKTRSACNHDCIIEVPVLKRTEKTIRTIVHGREKTLRIGLTSQGVEFVCPWGRHSMAPLVDATDKNLAA